jgi:hypothetical protein
MRRGEAVFSELEARLCAEEIIFRPPEVRSSRAEVRLRKLEISFHCAATSC